MAFGRAPSDIRFKPACQYIAVQLIVMAAANPISATGRRLAELRAVLGDVSESPPEAFKAQDGEDIKDPVSGGS